MAEDLAGMVDEPRVLGIAEMMNYPGVIGGADDMVAKARLGHTTSLAYGPYPVADERYLVEDTVEYPNQVNGKVRSRVTVAADAAADAVEEAALADAKVVELLAGRAPRKVIVVPGRLVNVVA